MGVVKNLVGQKFGRLTVIEQHGYGKPNNCTWIPMSEQYKNKQSNWWKQKLPEPYNKGE